MIRIGEQFMKDNMPCQGKGAKRREGGENGAKTGRGREGKGRKGEKGGYQGTIRNEIMKETCKLSLIPSLFIYLSISLFTYLRFGR